jgi:tetratricopeptide (TPR) repeat protein
MSSKEPKTIRFSEPWVTKPSNIASKKQGGGSNRPSLGASVNALVSRRALFARGAFLVLLVGLGLSQRTTAQTSMSGHDMGLRDEIPPDKLPSPQKLSGIGNVSIEITATPEAQIWFNQGLNLLHDFWEYESAKAFEQGIRVDPQCAMCYWGLYKAEGSFHSTAQGYANQALATAATLESRVSGAERLYIDASVAHEDAIKAEKQEQPDFSKETALWHKLVEEYPKDSQAKIFLAQSVGDFQEYLTILQGVLKEEPENSAANHYWVHAREVTHPDEALHSAEILASLAPNSGHMVHMPGHIFYLMGDYERAEKAFAASMQVDEKYMREQHVKPDDDWNYVHNLMYAIANKLEEGKLRDATTLSMKLTGARGELDTTLYTYASRDSISRLNPLLPVALRTGNWQNVFQLLKTPAETTNQSNLAFLARTLTDFAGGMLAVEGRHGSKAEESSLRVDADLWQASQQLKDGAGPQPNQGGSQRGDVPKLAVMPDALLQPLINSLSVMSLELRGSVAVLNRRLDDGKKIFAQAAQEEKALGYREPPNYIRPVGETEGAALMAAGDWADAKEAYKRALLERPRSGLALYGIAICSERSGDSAAATAAYRDFLEAWKDADPELPQLLHAKSYAAVRHTG